MNVKRTIYVILLFLLHTISSLAQSGLNAFVSSMYDVLEERKGREANDIRHFAETNMHNWKEYERKGYTVFPVYNVFRRSPMVKGDRMSFLGLSETDQKKDYVNGVIGADIIEHLPSDSIFSYLDTQRTVIRCILTFHDNQFLHCMEETDIDRRQRLTSTAPRYRLLASLIQEEQPDYVFFIGELKDYFFFLKQQEMKCFQWQRNGCPGADGH